MEPVYREFGERLREARLHSGLSQESLARRVGLTRTSITNIELGKQRIPLHLLLELAASVGRDPISLLPTSHSYPQVSPQIMQRLNGLPKNDQEWVKQIVGSVTHTRRNPARGQH